MLYVIAACIWISVYVRMYVCMYVIIEITFMFKSDRHLISLATNVLCYVCRIKLFTKLTQICSCNTFLKQ